MSSNNRPDWVRVPLRGIAEPWWTNVASREDNAPTSSTEFGGTTPCALQWTCSTTRSWTTQPRRVLRQGGHPAPPGAPAGIHLRRSGGPRGILGSLDTLIHAGLRVTDAAFDAFVGHLTATSKELGVQGASFGAVVEELTPLRDEVVTRQEGSTSLRLMISSRWPSGSRRKQRDSPIIFDGRGKDIGSSPSSTRQACRVLGNSDRQLVGHSVRIQRGRRSPWACRG